MRIISFMTGVFSTVGSAIGRRLRAGQERERLKERAEFETGLKNQLDLIPKRDKVQRIFAESGFDSLTVEPTSLKDYLYIKGEVSVTDYKKYREVLSNALNEIGFGLSPCINPETLISGKVRIAQFLRAVNSVK